MRHITRGYDWQSGYRDVYALRQSAEALGKRDAARDRERERVPGLGFLRGVLATELVIAVIVVLGFAMRGVMS